MDDLISRQAAIDALDVLCQEHRYKIPGKSETYSQYNEAWQDALDRAEGAIFNLPSAQLAQDLPNGCTDTISRAAVGDALNRIEISRNAMWYEFYHKALTAVETLPSAQPGWIPVTERLPENDNDVLVTDGTDCAVAYWRTDAQAWDDSMHGWCDLYGLEVTAWMPLPTPYREGGQDDH